MIAFKDFLPKQLTADGLLGIGGTFESLDQTLLYANQWLSTNNISPINVETILMPGISHQQGTGAARGYAYGQHLTYWYQFIRVWYHA